MSQFDFGTINPSTKSGTALASDLNSWRDSLNSSHKGTSRPTYAQAGMVWIDDVSASLWKIYIFDGTNDVLLREINPTTHAPIAFQLVDGGTGGTDAPSARTSLGLGDVATEDVVPILKGGTGATVASTARTNLGLGSVATLNLIPIAQGGTNATTAAAARTNLGLGAAALETVGVAIGDLFEIVDVGGAVPGLPALDGSLLTGLPSNLPTEVYITSTGAGNFIVPAGVTSIRVELAGGGGGGRSSLPNDIGGAAGVQTSFDTTILAAGGSGSDAVPRHGEGSGGDFHIRGGGSKPGGPSTGGLGGVAEWRSAGFGALTVATLVVVPLASIPYVVGAGGVGGSGSGSFPGQDGADGYIKISY